MTDRARRRELRRAYERAQREQRMATCPVTVEQLAALVEHVDAQLLTAGCDHTTRHAERWAAAQRLEWDELVGGLAGLGGYCDCEIVMNCDPGIVFGR